MDLNPFADYLSRKVIKLSSFSIERRREEKEVDVELDVLRNKIKNLTVSKNSEIFGKNLWKVPREILKF